MISVILFIPAWQFWLTEQIELGESGKDRWHRCPGVCLFFFYSPLQWSTSKQAPRLVKALLICPTFTGDGSGCVCRLPSGSRSLSMPKCCSALLKACSSLSIADVFFSTALQSNSSGLARRQRERLGSHVKLRVLIFLVYLMINPCKCRKKP